MMSGMTSGFAVIGLSTSIVACAGLSLSAALHIFGGFVGFPLLAEAAPGTATQAAHNGTTSSALWLSVWNILLPTTILAITLVTFRTWRERENSSQQ